MLNYGIDQAAIYTPNYYLPLQSLAQHHGLANDYYQRRIGQSQMAILPADEDIITMAAQAATVALERCKTDDIELLLFATESCVDQSKSAAIYLHQLLGLSPRCRCLELKQACYSGTAGIQLALDWLRVNPTKKALVVCADVARYALDSDAEGSQGAGAVAMVLSAQPRLLAIESGSGIYSHEVNDFWRPPYSDTAFVDGRLSCDAYIKSLRKTWEDYQRHSGRKFSDHQHFCFHVPFPKLVETAMQKLARFETPKRIPHEQIEYYLGGCLDYNRQIGNCYTASLYISLISQLEHSLCSNTTTSKPTLKHDLSGKRIGIYSYGSGACAEYFSMQVQTNYQHALHKNYHQRLLQQRQVLNVEAYQQMHAYKYCNDGSEQIMPQMSDNCFRLDRIAKHTRYYTHQTATTKLAHEAHLGHSTSSDKAHELLPSN